MHLVRQRGADQHEKDNDARGWWLVRLCKCTCRGGCREFTGSRLTVGCMMGVEGRSGVVGVGVVDFEVFLKRKTCDEKIEA